MFVLDTNILSDYFKGHERIRARIVTAPKDRVIVTTAISWFEIISGRFASVIKAADREQLLLAVERLASDQRKLGELKVVPITEEVAVVFERLRTDKKLKKIGREDFLIACITLANEATLVTRNTKDFTNIPGLKLENWTD
jgi:tRNA(fMet)-specific endonuclease VapC